MISAVIIAFNNQDYIEEAVRSAVRQTPAFSKIVIVDDGSSDDTREILQRLRDENDIIQLVLHDKNRGPGGARNTGVAQVESPFFCFLDGDDIFFDDANAKFHAAVEASADADLWLFEGKRFTHEGTGRKIGGVTAGEFVALDEKRAAFRSTTFPWNKLYRTAYVKDNGISFPDGKYEDIPWCYECVLKAGKIAAQNVQIVWYRLHGTSTLQKQADHHFDALGQWSRVFDMFEAHEEAGAVLGSYIKANSFHQLTTIFFEKRVPEARQREFGEGVVALFGSAANIRGAIKAQDDAGRRIKRLRRFRKDMGI